MADFKMSRAILVFAVIGFYNVRLIHLAESDIESKVDILEYLLHGVLKHEIAGIKDTLRDIQNDKPDHECCKTGQQPGLNQTSGDGIQRLVDEVTTKTKAMIKAFSTEKKQLRRQGTYLNEALSVIRVTVDDHENQTRDIVDQMKDNHQVDFEQLISKIEIVRQQSQQSQQKCDSVQQLVDDHESQTRDLVDQMKDNHKVDFEQLINKIEIVRQQSQQSQQKCDSVQQLVETLSADIDSIKSNIDGITRQLNPVKEAMRCKAGWIRQLNSCILYVETDPKTWFKAQDYCKIHGGFLVEPYSSAAFTLLMEGENRTEHWMEINDDSKWRLWWIGATDRVQEGVWRWESTGQKIGIVPKWNEYEPNNAGGSEDCAILVYARSGINDVKCRSLLNHFICEIKL